MAVDKRRSWDVSGGSQDTPYTKPDSVLINRELTDEGSHSIIRDPQHSSKSSFLHHDTYAVVSKPSEGRYSMEDRVRKDLDHKTPRFDEAMDQNRDPSSIPALPLDTQRRASTSSGTAEPHKRSPLGITSPTKVANMPNKSLPSNLPISPRTRDRGFSLRRSLLARSIQESSRSNGSSLELQTRSLSASDSPSHAETNVPPSNKRPGPRVTIAPLPDMYRRPKSAKEDRTPLALPNYETWMRSRAARSELITKIGGLYQKLRKVILRIQEIPSSENGRHLQLDVSRKKPLIDERTGKEYINNIIRSSKYTLWNFLPRQLFAQFSKLANFYFLCVSVLQMIPGLSTTGNYTTIIPLTFFVTLSMAKEGYDDFRRYRLDKAENNKMTAVLHAYKPIIPSQDTDRESNPQNSGPKHWADVKWKDVRVGDVVKLKRDEAAPADLVILRSTGADGIAYIETMALDGETNLKSKQASPSLDKACQSIDHIANCDAHLVVEDPNLDLYSFEGKCTVTGETLPLTNNGIVYRGSILRNTPELYGLVVYSGEECKIRMNATKNPRIKAPTLQAVVNKIVVIIVLFVIALAIFNTVAYQIWAETTQETAWYLNNASVAFFPIFTSFIILFNTMIPLSLYVSLEVVKLFQLFLMNDIEMYDEDSNTPMEARTSTINEELGQVSYVFTDKTGTLTNNSMKFRKMSVAGTAWLHDPDLQLEAMRASIKRAASQKPHGKGKKPMRCKNSTSIRRKIPDHSFSDVPISDTMLGRNSSVSSRWTPSTKRSKHLRERRTIDLLRYVQKHPKTIFARGVQMFILSIALCHTCIPERKDDEITYQAASPDEQALVQAAQELGFVVLDRQNAIITIKTFPFGLDDQPSYSAYEILDVIEFSSSRKRMSIIVRFPDSRICLFCKGADSVVAERLRLSNLALDKAIMVERRASERKSLEAQEAIRRNSEHTARKNSMGRSSFSLTRHSIGGLPRPNMTVRRLQPIRDEIDSWLKDREMEVKFSPQIGESAHRTPRPSGHFDPEPTHSFQDVRVSFQGDEIDEIVDEASVIDDSTVFERCFQHVNDFATEGLRTLLYGYRFIEEDEYRSWKKVYKDASTSLINRQEMLERAGDLVETRLELAGATAIEDKLQEGVPESIDKLRRAKIKMWMLTGDKRETAINIGHSCRLIKDYSTITILDHESGNVNQRIAAAFVEISRGQIAHSVVVIDGHTLGLIEASDTLRKLFIDLAIEVDSVICCRASPSQKAYLVSAIRRKVKNAVTLAIGDGANDIAMIQEAHVGIGITGKEGLQAARTSDYSIAQFRFLLKLLLVHGRWNYVRTCKYTLGTFWKEMVFYLTQALYQRYAGYTGTSLYESWSLAMFNTLFTSLPVIFMGIFEKDLAASTLLAVPELYTFGHRNGGFNLFVYGTWVFMASAEAVMVFFITIGLYGQALFTTDNDLYAMGTLIFTACVIIIATKIQFIELHSKSVLCVLAMGLSIGGWTIWNLIFSAFYTHNTQYDVRDGLLDRFGRNALWWLTLILIVVACWMFEFAVKCMRMAWIPDDVDTFQELEKDKGVKRRFEEAAGFEIPGDHNTDAVDIHDYESRVEEDERREDDIQKLLERPREVLSGGVGTRRRRQKSDATDSKERSDELGDSQRVAFTTKVRETSNSESEEDDDEERKGKRHQDHGRRSTDMQEMLRRGFGSVRRSLDIGSMR